MSSETYIYDTRIFVPQDDTLEYKVYVSKTVPRGDATLTAVVAVLANSQKNTPEMINQRVLEALAEFVPVRWECMSQERSTISPGFEQVRVQALARIGPEQNRNLEERGRHASREGLEITNIRVKSTLPQDQVDQIVKELWFDTVEQVNEHMAEFNRVSGRAWRIGNIVYGVPSDTHSRTISAKGAYREEPYELFGALIESGLVGAEKICLTAQVTLKSPRPGKATTE